MKTALFPTALLGSLCILSSSAFGLVIEQAQCKTADGAYTVSVSENQGTGFKRPSPGPMSAQLTDASGSVLLTSDVELFRGLSPISFARTFYRDVATSGDVLKLEGPSTNFQNYILTAVVNGATIHDENLSCSIFFGVVL